MKRLVALAVGLLALSASSVWAAPVDIAQNNQIHKAFINTSGAALSSGAAVILNFANSNTTTADTASGAMTLGMDVTTTTTANDRRFVGVVASDTCINNGLCDVIVYGPALAQFTCNPVQPSGGVGQPVGTSTRAGELGFGLRAGVQLSNNVQNTGNGSNPCLRWVFVNPDNSSGGAGSQSPVGN